MDIPGKRDVKRDGAIIQYYSFTGGIKAARQKHKHHFCPDILKLQEAGHCLSCTETPSEYKELEAK